MVVTFASTPLVYRYQNLRGGCPTPGEELHAYMESWRLPSCYIPLLTPGTP